MSFANHDPTKPAYELHALLRNADDITQSAANITAECRRFMAHLQKVLAGPDAQALRQEMGEALARLLGAFDGYAAAVAKHSVAFAVAVDDAAGWVEVVKASCAAAVGGSGSGGGEGECVFGNDEGEDERSSLQSSSSSASGRTVIKTTRPLRTFSVDLNNAHGSFSSSSFSLPKSPARAPVPPVHSTPPFHSPLAVQPINTPSPARTVSPDPQTRFQTSALQEAISQVGETDTQTRPSPALSPASPKSALTFGGPSPPTAESQLSPLGGATASTSRASSISARTPSPAGATYSLSSPSSSSSSRTCSPFSSPSSPASSTVAPSLHTAERAYTVVARGVNVRGNRWERRDYGPGSPKRNTLHYSNVDGSCYSSLPDGSERFESARGRVFLRVADKGDGGERAGRGGGWRRCTGPAVGGGGGGGGGGERGVGLGQSGA